MLSSLCALVLGPVLATSFTVGTWTGLRDAVLYQRDAGPVRVWTVAGVYADQVIPPTYAANSACGLDVGSPGYLGYRVIHYADLDRPDVTFTHQAIRIGTRTAQDLSPSVTLDLDLSLDLGLLDHSRAGPRGTLGYSERTGLVVALSPAVTFGLHHQEWRYWIAGRGMHEWSGWTYAVTVAW